MRLGYNIELFSFAGLLGSFVLLLAFPFALIAVAVLLVVAVAGIVALAGALVAAPVLLARAAWRRWRVTSEEQPVEELAYTAPVTVSRPA